MSKPDVYIRADGNSKMGLGHVIRSCALAHVLRNQFNCTFFIRQPSEYLTRQIADSGCRLVSLPDNVDYLQEAADWAASLTGNEIIVLDGYQFDTNYQQNLKTRRCKLVCIDDIHHCRFLADVVINHAGGISVGHYNSLPHTQFFLGFRYSLLRPPFFLKRTVAADDLTLLICLGGADPANDTMFVLNQSLGKGFQKIHVLVGSAYRFRTELEQFIKGAGVPIQLHQNLDAGEVALLMQQCGSAVLSPSSTVLEYMSFGGAVYLHQIADNQQFIKEHLLEAQLAKPFTDLGILAPEAINIMKERQQQTFDGRSAERLLQIFDALHLMHRATAATLAPGDETLTLEWANDTLARKMSYNSDPILPHNHNRWFTARLDTADTYFIFRDGDAPLGQIRFDKKDAGYVLSYFVAAAYRNKGLGSFLLSEGIALLAARKATGAASIAGYVKKDNVSSCRSFEKMSFVKTETTDYPNTYKYVIQL